MISIGISETRNDEFYRYKREIIQTRIVAKNGSQTEILNLELISKQLKVPSGEIRKEFSKKLGAISKGNFISGSFQTGILEEILQSFIERKVLCKKCKLPELGKDGVCRSCGSESGKLVPGRVGKKLLSSEKQLENELSADEEVPGFEVSGSGSEVSGSGSGSGSGSEVSGSDSSNPTDLEQSQYLHRLYDLREGILQGKNTGVGPASAGIQDIDGAIDRIWACPDDKWPKLKKKMDEFLVFLGVEKMKI